MCHVWIVKRLNVYCLIVLIFECCVASCFTNLHECPPWSCVKKAIEKLSLRRICTTKHEKSSIFKWLISHYCKKNVRYFSSSQLCFKILKFNFQKRKQQVAGSYTKKRTLLISQKWQLFFTRFFLLNRKTSKLFTWFVKTERREAAIANWFELA